MFVNQAYKDSYYQEQLLELNKREREIANEFNHQIKFQLASLVRMGNRWNCGFYSKKNWSEDALSFYNDFSDFQAISWVDNTFHVRWIVPLKGNEKAVNLNLAFEERRKKALIAAREKNSMTVTAPIDLVQGGKGFLAYLPLYKNSKFDGFISSVFRTDKLFGNFFQEYDKEFYFKISHENTTISTTMPNPPLTKGRPLSFLGENWSIQIIPIKASFFQSPFQKYLFPIGIFLSLFITAIAFLLKQSQQKSFELTQLNSSLIHKNEELDLAQKASAEASFAKSRFLANMSHEIRTPLNGILGAAELGKQSNSLEDCLEYNEIIHASSNSLLEIINDILDFSKIESGKLHVNNIPTDIPQTLKHIYQLMLTPAKEKSLDLHFNLPSKFHSYWITDPTRLRQIIVNLIGNAIKFTDKGSVSLTLKENENTLSFIIEDQGIGISKARQEVIFNEFEQADTSTTREFGGTGLGLAISKQLSQLLGGDLTLKSELNEGSQFTLELELTKCDAPRKENDEKSSQFNLQKILLCEDNRTNQIIAKKVLTKMNLSVDVANNGKEGLELFKVNNYDLILMDMQMPVMDGLEATRKIRELDKDLPIIALTANVTIEDNQLCKDAEMNGFLTKPLKSNLLSSELKKWLREKSKV